MSDNSASKNPLLPIGIIGVVIIAVLAFFLLSSSEEETVDPVVETQPTPAPKPVVVYEPPVPVEPEVEEVDEPAIVIEPEVIEEPLPALDESTPWMLDKIADLPAVDNTETLISSSELIRNFVVFIDNAAKGDLAHQFSPVIAPQKAISVKTIKTEGEVYYLLNKESYKRYDGIASLINNLPVEQSISLFNKSSPLIEEAYTELGYAGGNEFNSTLVKAIDLALSAPVIKGDIRLIAPSAMYQFSNPDLENLEPIQKLMIRMGPENQKIVREKLMQFKAALN
ncbi:DUF3014 domain-containing protein [Algibacillus agarilyticus]|uniref:DUF3014 domain-containing protein n=1 Tax=Algibacillus agarilyticus TaxID=2234133 RepID=UPI000DCF9766|nr:DUF3014 domain-containing protein [Algibacillus agarilyticus]